MSLSRPIPRRVGLLIQRVADGVASPRELDRFERLVDGSPEVLAELERVQALSGALRSHLMGAAVGVDFAALQAQVLREVRDPAAHRPSLWERMGVWVRETLVHQPGIWAPAAACGVAVVLGLVVPSLVREPASLPAELAAGRGTEIHSLDTDATTAMVFETPASGLTVIWLAGTDEAEEDEELEVTEDEVLEDSVATPDEVEAEVSPDDDTATP